MERKIKLFDENLIGQDGLSRYQNPNTNWQRDIDDYDIGVYTDRMCFIKEVDPSKVNVAWIIEPPIINGENYKHIVEHQDKFNWVFSHIKSLGDKIKNFVWLGHGGTWLRERDMGVKQKTRNVSMIYSNKEWNAGHRFRHLIAEQIKDLGVALLGTGSQQPLDWKFEGLSDYRFSIVMENSIEDDYFTEKLIDCMLCGTIPIYYGTKNVKHHFRGDGIFFFEDIEELKSILSECTEEKYNSLIDAVNHNFEVAKTFMHPEQQITSFLNNALPQ